MTSPDNTNKLPGNTNFAIVAHTEGDISEPWNLLRKNPFWLLDCGPETISLLAELDAFKQLQGVIITHAHTDHSGGLASLAYRMMFIEKCRIPLIAPLDVFQLLSQQLVELQYLLTPKAVTLGAPKSSSSTFFNIVPLHPDFLKGRHEYVPANYCHFTLSFFPVDHNIQDFPSYGVKIYTPSSKQIWFSGDTAYPLEGMNEAYMVFHDTQTYNPGDGYEVHCPYRKLREVVPIPQRGMIILCHTQPQEQFTEHGFKHAKRWSVFS